MWEVCLLYKINVHITVDSIFKLVLMKLLAEQAYFLWTESFVGYLDLVD